MVISVLGILAGVLLAAPGQREVVGQADLIIAGSWSGYTANELIVKRFGESRGVASSVMGANNSRAFDYLHSRKAEVVIYSPETSRTAEKAIMARFSDRTRVREYVLGHFVVAIIVHPASSVKRLSIAELRSLLTGKATDSRDGQQGVRGIAVVGEPPESKGHEVLRKAVLQGANFSAKTHYLKDAEAVARFVAKNRHAIGFVLCRQSETTHVRKVPIGVSDGDLEVPPTPDTIAAGAYPLVERLSLFIDTQGSERAKEYCEYACGPDATMHLRGAGLWPEFDMRKVRGELRVKQMVAGRGTPIRFCGVTDAEPLARDLAVEYVKAKALVQVEYDSQASAGNATERFLGDRELLLISGALGKDITEGQGWSAVNPQGAILGTLAVGVVVHADNTAKEFTLEDLRLIYSGEIDKWPGVEGAAAGIRIFGLASDSGAMKLVEEVVQGDTRRPHPQPLSRERERGADAAQPSSPAPRPSQPGTRGWSGARIRGRWCCRWPISRGRSGLWI